MKWATPSDSYFPFGAFKSTNPVFMAQVPLLKHLAAQCDSVGTGPAATEQGLATITNHQALLALDCWHSHWHSHTHSFAFAPPSAFRFEVAFIKHSPTTCKKTL